MIEIDNSKLIEIESITERYNTLDEIKALIELAKTKSGDLSEIYIKQIRNPYTISLNLLIVEKIIDNDIEINNEAREIINQLDPNKEYTISTPNYMHTETLISYAYSYYQGHKEVGLGVLELLLDPNQGANLNPIVYREMPLLYVAIEEAAHGDMALWNLYTRSINHLKTTYCGDHDNVEDHSRGVRLHVIEKLHLNEPANTYVGYSFNALQWVAYENEGEERTPLLKEIAQQLIDLGMDPYQTARYERGEGNFFEISGPTDHTIEGWTPADFGLEIEDNEKVIEVGDIYSYRTLEDIKALIAEAKTRSEDLSEVYVRSIDLSGAFARNILGNCTISLNLLIVERIIANNTLVNDEVVEILNQLDTGKEYTISTPNYTHTKTLTSHAYWNYRDHKETGFKVLEYLLAPERVGEHNPIVAHYGNTPLLYVAIEAAGQGDIALWSLYERYINYLKENYEVDYIIEILGLNEAVETDYGELNALQYVASQYEGREDNTLFLIAQGFINLGMDPYQITNFEGEDKDFFGISVPTNGGKGWKAADFGLEPSTVESGLIIRRVLIVLGGMLGGVVLPLIFRGSGIMNNLSFPAENLIICFGGGFASALLVFSVLMIYEAATAEEPDWKKAGLSALLSFGFSTVVIGGQELAHHFLPKLPECTIAIYVVGAIGIALLHALAVPAITEKVVN